MKFTALLFTLFYAFCSTAQSQLKLEDIMQGNTFIGQQPANAFWSWDNKRLYFDWNPENEPGNSLYYWEKGMSAAKKVPASELPDSYIRDKKQHGQAMRYYIQGGALFRFNTQSRKHEKLYHTSKSVSNLQVLQQGKVIYFEQENNLFRFDPASGAIRQITNFKSGNKNAATEETENFLKNQQLELFAYVRDQDKSKKWNKQQQQLKKISFPKSYAYGSWDLENLQVSPDEKFVLFRLSKYPEDKETQIEKYVTADGNSTDEKARSKVSVYNVSEHKMGVYNVEADSVYYVNFSSLSELDRAPAYLSLYNKDANEKREKRPIAMTEAIFSENGNHTVLVVRSFDNKDRWIVKLDLKTGKPDELEHQHDPAWIGGPGIGDWAMETGTLGFLADQEQLYFQSEASGYSHLYLLNVITKKKTQLTSGNWEVREVWLAANKKHFYLSANKTHPGNRDFYRLPVNGGTLENILTADGAHEVEMSPDEKTLAIRYSFKNKPWELYIAENKVNTAKTKITHSTTPAFEAYPWREPEVITFAAKDQTTVYARLYQPKKEVKNGAAVIFVHGAGYLQNAHNHWSNYLREYMFHNMLADEGYTILDIDYRASDGYGRDFRTGIYRFMGGLDLSDQLDGRQLLIDKYGIDSTRIGMYGGSYGGFITLMALFTKPNAFACGAALRSVTDWAHYNQEYTSNILNFPETDPEAYRKSSPIYYAENLQDPLLMLHGVVDDNVQFQDIIRLSQRLIELGKKDWDLAVFPVEAHGFKEATSWIDEYRRIYELFSKELKK